MSNVLSIHWGWHSSPRVCTSHAGTPKILMHQLSMEKEVSFSPPGWGSRNIARRKSKESALEWYIMAKGPNTGDPSITRRGYICAAQRMSLFPASLSSGNDIALVSRIKSFEEGVCAAWHNLGLNRVYRRNKTDWLHDEDSQHSSVEKLWQRDSPLSSYQRQTFFKTAVSKRN